MLLHLGNSWTKRVNWSRASAYSVLACVETLKEPCYFLLRTSSGDRVLPCFPKQGFRSHFERAEIKELKLNIWNDKGIPVRRKGQSSPTLLPRELWRGACKESSALPFVTCSCEAFRVAGSRSVYALNPKLEGAGCRVLLRALFGV